MNKIVTGVIVVVLVALGIYYMSAGKPSAPVADTTAETATSSDETRVTSATDISDEALDKDLANIDAQVGSLGEDSATIDAGLNDKSVAQ